MCRIVRSIVQAIACLVELFIRIFMTFVLMVESLISMIFQSFYNLLSFLFQIISLLPVCCVFLVTSKIRCSICGGSGGCTVARAGTCDYLMSFVALVLLFLIFRATGILDKFFHRLGYAKSGSVTEKYSRGIVTDWSKNETDYQWYNYDDEEYVKHVNNTLLQLRSKEAIDLDTEDLQQDFQTDEQTDKQLPTTLESPSTTTMIPKIELTESTDLMISTVTKNASPIATTQTIQIARKGLAEVEYLEVSSTTQQDQLIVLSPKGWGPKTSHTEWTTVLYYLVA